MEKRRNGKVRLERLESPNDKQSRLFQGQPKPEVRGKLNVTVAAETWHCQEDKTAHYCRLKLMTTGQTGQPEERTFRRMGSQMWSSGNPTPCFVWDLGSFCISAHNDGSEAEEAWQARVCLSHLNTGTIYAVIYVQIYEPYIGAASSELTLSTPRLANNGANRGDRLCCRMGDEG